MPALLLRRDMVELEANSALCCDKAKDMFLLSLHLAIPDKETCLGPHASKWNATHRRAGSTIYSCCCIQFRLAFFCVHKHLHRCLLLDVLDVVRIAASPDSRCQPQHWLSGL